MPLTPTYTSTNIRGMDLPYTAEAILAYNNMDKGSTADQKIKLPGFINGGCPYHHQRGHMIGMKLGGDGGDARNLVTLIDGTNHPFMYDFEERVFKHVKANPGMKFIYKVTANYDASKYVPVPTSLTHYGSPLGAMGNPYCPFPCPESLSIEFFQINTSVMILDVPSLSRLGDAVIIPNGIYKHHEGSAAHISEGCFAA